MQIYITLLRGVNVGGNNKIDMKRLKEVFANAGFVNVQTYINSGNVIFSSNKDAVTVQTQCEDLIAEQFGLNIAVAVLTAQELSEALDHTPDWWGNTPDTKHNAIFVIPPAKAEAVCAEVGDIKPEYEKVAYHGKLIFWSAPVKTFAKTRWSTIAKQATYQKITIRNSNTAFKLAELSKE
ncbi:DUF1697 domain-containing protein [Candidatus Bathycorpusculum sp.]|jgi:uncharacterized protein (DUF1697 family)|uniref:DUF1697 domain-containing protein n=1 Tax=Candidatus Bathycorpusculum sp. TaxID=2994959 RepID=UPI0028342306|nr:DUF1697 domain-containing protein [Candidatus Termitimicrobium sp.]MCL2686727.1 DUF1697 domain-containing protein [Candidatus Termitimicrobium sp.]